MARYINLTYKRPTGHEIRIAPPVVLWENAKKGVGEARGAVMARHVLPALKAKHRGLAIMFEEWDLSCFTEGEIVVSEPVRRSAEIGARRTARSRVPVMATAGGSDDGDPDCRCDGPGRCPVHDSRG